MKNLKLELFNFRKDLNYDQQEISVIAESHINACDYMSEKRVIASLNEKLKKYTYDDSVRSLLEDLNTDEYNNQLIYDLKDLYYTIISKDNNELYTQPLQVIMNIINMDDTEDKIAAIVNNLSIYQNWIPEIKIFIDSIINSPKQKSDVFSAGTANPVYTIVERVDNGFVAYIKDSWFLLSDDSIRKVMLEDFIKDEAQLHLLRDLQTMINLATITSDMITFIISPDLSIGFGVGEKNEGIYINGECYNDDPSSTLSAIFSSTVIPIVNKQFYPLLDEVQKNLDKFVELDVVMEITNIIKPTLTYYTFNYKNGVYAYVCEENYNGGGMVTDFYQYDKAQDLVDEIQEVMGYDLTYFYEDKLKNETVIKKKLEDKERQISVEIDNLSSNIDRLESTLKVVGDSDELSEALKVIKTRRESLNEDLMAIKALKTKNISRL